MEEQYEVLLENLRKVQQERDELAAQVEVMREALKEMMRDVDDYERRTCSTVDGWPDKMKVALSITGPDALREIQARTLEDAAYWFECQAYRETMWSASRARAELREMAEAKRIGEE